MLSREASHIVNVSKKQCQNPLIVTKMEKKCQTNTTTNQIPQQQDDDNGDDGIGDDEKEEEEQQQQQQANKKKKKQLKKAIAISNNRLPQQRRAYEAVSRQKEGTASVSGTRNEMVCWHVTG